MGDESMVLVEVVGPSIDLSFNFEIPTDTIAAAVVTYRLITSAMIESQREPPTVESFVESAVESWVPRNGVDEHESIDAVNNDQMKTHIRHILVSLIHLALENPTSI